MEFNDRQYAGRRLATELQGRIHWQEAAVFAVPRGGVVLGAEIAACLGLPLEAVVVRKIGHPYNPAYTIGAVTEKGEPVINRLEAARIQVEWLSRRVSAARHESRLLRERYAAGRTPLNAAGKVVLLVDDGVETGCTLEAAICELHDQGAQRVIVAVPVLPAEIALRMRHDVNDVIVLEEVASRNLIADSRGRFPPVTDEDVVRALRAHASRPIPEGG